MKITLDLDDLEELFEVDGQEVCGQELKDLIFDKLCERIAKELTSDFHYVYSVNDTITKEISAIVKEQREDIINKVTEKIATKIANLKEIKEMTPKKKDIDVADAEWKEYFTTLMSEVIAKKFK